MIYKYFKKFFKYFKEEKKSFILYSGLSLLAAIFELCGVALTYPFIMKILSENNQSSDWRTSPMLIGAVIILLFLLKNLFMIAYTYIQTKYTTNFCMKIQRRFMRYFIGASYQETSKISLAQKGKIFGLLTNSTMSGFIFRLLNISVNFFIFIFITACLAIKFPIATAATFLFGVLMLSIQTKIYKPYLEKIAKRISESSLLLNHASNDALLHIKAVKISNNEKYFYDNYNNRLITNINNHRKSNFLSSIPPYVTEPFAILMLFVLVAVISSQTYTEPQKLVASLALVGAAIFRLTPAISRMQVNINGLNAVLPLVEEFINIYEKLGINNVPEITQKDFAEFNKTLELKNISFKYNDNKQILKDINFKINKGDFVGIAGSSGVGKTTLVDIITGLFKAQSGEILIDDKLQNKPLKIGYVPQEFFMIKGNIRENVAFGSPIIDDERVIDALKKAQLYDYIINNYKDGIYSNPFVDSSGFSQGQKQRLAIARALYSNPDILILDEATSALDKKTEEDIHKELNFIKGKTTIIVITHRLSNLKSTDKIIYMQNGKIAGIGTFSELVDINAEFRDLVNIE